MGFFSRLFKRPRKPEITLSVSSPLRNAIVEKFRSSTEYTTDFLYGLMVPITQFDFPDLPYPLYRIDIKGPLNSDEALLYVGHFYFAWLFRYAGTKGNGSLGMDLVVAAHVEFCKLYAEIYSVEIPKKEARRTFYNVDMQLSRHKLPDEEILANILADKILHFDGNLKGINLDQETAFTDIVMCVRIWMKSYMGVAMNMVDDAKKRLYISRESDRM